MKQHVIVLEIRPPKTKEEKKCYGMTTTIGEITRIYLNKGQSVGELLNTTFHEFAHFYQHWMGSSLTDSEQERIARLVGNVAEPCFRRYPK